MTRVHLPPAPLPSPSSTMLPSPRHPTFLPSPCPGCCFGDRLFLPRYESYRSVSSDNDTRPPPLHHCRGARVYGSKTTDMNEKSTPPIPPPAPPLQPPRYTYSGVPILRPSGSRPYLVSEIRKNRSAKKKKKRNTELPLIPYNPVLSRENNACARNIRP